MSAAHTETLLAYAFTEPRPGPEIIGMLRRVELAVYGGVGEEGGAPPLRASCGERHGMAYWSLDGSWHVGDGRAVATHPLARADRLASGERMLVEGELRELSVAGGWAWGSDAAALTAFAGDAVARSQPLRAVALAGVEVTSAGAGIEVRRWTTG